MLKELINDIDRVCESLTTNDSFTDEQKEALIESLSSVQNEAEGMVE